MSRSVYFSHGTKNEQYLLEDLIIESIKIYGNDFFYIPRILVAKDHILGEDRLSEFKNSFLIEAYLESVEGFGGQGAFIQKFGLFVEQSATITIARRRWDQLIGRYGASQIPSRPTEGDLLYFPLTNGLFEIKFVEHQDAFYQLGKLYVFKLQIEQFQYASERLSTGVREIDIFENIKSLDADMQNSKIGGVNEITVVSPGSGYTTADVNFITVPGDTGSGAEATAIIGAVGTADEGKITGFNIVARGAAYSVPPIVQITGDGTLATASCTIAPQPDLIDSYGDNIKFADEYKQIIWNEDNPFGDLK